MPNVKFTIAEWRRLKNMSQQRLADLCGVHLNTVRHWEDNPREIKLIHANKIAEIFEVSLENIIFLPSDTTKGNN